jgi:hypothetical protein
MPLPPEPDHALESINVLHVVALVNCVYGVAVGVWVTVGVTVGVDVLVGVGDGQGHDVIPMITPFESICKAVFPPSQVVLHHWLAPFSVVVSAWLV